MLALVIWVCFGIGAAVVASNRGGSGILWFFVGFLFGPIGFLLSFTAGVRCPYCQTKVSMDAVVCKACRGDLSKAVWKQAS